MYDYLDFTPNFDAPSISVFGGDSSSPSVITSPTPAENTSVNWAAGLVQSGLALGTSYLTRRLDIDLAQRLAGLQPTVSRQGTQNQLGGSADLSTRAVGSIGSMRLGDLLPFAVLGLGAWLLFGKG